MVLTYIWNSLNVVETSQNPDDLRTDLAFHWFTIAVSDDQWPFQEPKLEVPTIYKAYFLGLCKGISPQNIALYGTNVPPFQDPETPIEHTVPKLTYVDTATWGFGRLVSTK